MSRLLGRALQLGPRAVLRRAAAQLRAAADPYAAFCYGQEGEDMVLSRLFEARRGPGFYVDVGAHHPRRFSNTRLFYARGWRGINIEPNPAAAALFRRERLRDVNLAIGVSDQAGELLYHEFTEPALNTFDAEFARSVDGANGNRLVATRPVPVMRLADVLHAHLPPGTHIDFLNVDVEGHDIAVLRSNDWTTYRPQCVLVELHRATFAALVETPVHQYLSGCGYECFAKTVNTVIYIDGRGAAGGRVGG